MERDRTRTKELEELSPLLAKADKPLQEDIPYGFFSRQRREMLSKISEPEKKAQGMPSWLSRLFQPKLSLAYGLMAVLIAALWFWNSNSSDPGLAETSINFEDISTEVALTYVEDNIYEFDDESLAMALSDDELDALMQELLDEEVSEELDLYLNYDQYEIYY